MIRDYSSRSGSFNLKDDIQSDLIPLSQTNRYCSCEELKRIFGRCCSNELRDAGSSATVFSAGRTSEIIISIQETIIISIRETNVKLTVLKFVTLLPVKFFYPHSGFFSSSLVYT